MTKAETRFQVQRVEKAIRLIQKKFHTNYHFMVTASATLKEELGSDSVMAVILAREQEDLQAWNVDIDVAAVAELKWREVLNTLYHECSHVFVGPLADLIPAGKTVAERKKITDIEENVANQLGRLFQLLIHGDVVERQFPHVETP